MAIEISLKEPSEIRAGDTLNWIKSLGDYPASDGWSLSYRLINAGNKYDISSTASNNDHLISVAAAVTASYAPGEYDLIGWVAKSGERYSIPELKVNVLPDLAVATAGYDTRSTAKKTLDLLDAALLEYGAQAWVQSYQISGRTMSFRSQSEFMAFRSRLRLDVNTEENADRLKRGLSPRNKILVRM